LADSLFAEGVVDDVSIQAHLCASTADNEFNKCKPSLNEIMKQIPVLQEQLLSMLCTLDFWGTLVDNYKKSKKYKAGNERK
jgi:hypothetical protein